MTQPLRCGIYARFSSEKQSPLSIVDQIRKCREYAEQRDWLVIDSCVFSDEGISGTTDDRPGLRHMLEAATSKEKLFDILLVDDSSRLSRRLKDSFTIHEELGFADVRLICISQGIDSASEQSEVLFATHGIMDSQYIRNLSKETRRGVEGKALAGLHTGGRCFGYQSVLEDSGNKDHHGRPLVTGVRLGVFEPQATIVRRIFQLYADGNSLQRIAKTLNAEGVVSPQPQKGRISRSWCPSSVRTILRNTRYRGHVIWGKTQKVRSKSGKRIYKRTTSDKWIVREIPEQRIISEELWAAVENRKETVKQLYGEIGRKGGMQRSVSSPYLFSGLLRCSECGANVVIVSGRWRGRRDVVYGCPQNAFRGTTVCQNGVRIFRSQLERKILATLQKQVLKPEAIEYVLERFEDEYTKVMQDLNGEMGQMRQRKERLEWEVANLANAIAQGDISPALRAALVERERQIGQITEKLLGTQPDSIQAKLNGVRSYVLSEMRNIREILNSNLTQMRAKLAKHIEKITLKPNGDTYIATGTWNFVGRGNIRGAGGQNRTGYARLFRAALYQ